MAPQVEEEGADGPGHQDREQLRTPLGIGTHHHLGEILGDLELPAFAKAHAVSRARSVAVYQLVSPES